MYAIGKVPTPTEVPLYFILIYSPRNLSRGERLGAAVEDRGRILEHHLRPGEGVELLKEPLPNLLW